MRVLLIDDEIVALNALNKRVDWVKYGFTDVMTAQDAASAKQMLSKHTIDLMISDIEMPGEDGLRLFEYAKQTYPLVECIFVTCHANFDYIKKAMKYKAWDYILKPIDYEELDNLLLNFAEYKEKMQQKLDIDQFLEKAKIDKKEKDADGDSRFDIVKQYIAAHIREQIYVEDLAKLVHLNSQHLMRTFKRETGQSILEYIGQQRITIASRLLKETDYTINFIADCVGCENYSYFTKLFKKHTGVTPREYRGQFKK